MSVNYVGKRTEGGGFEVRCNGRLLRPRHDLFNHSPDGFAWGYGGSGPAQLALAILADHLTRVPADRQLARRLVARPGAEVPEMSDHNPDNDPDALAIIAHQSFKWAVVQAIPMVEGFSLSTEDVTKALGSMVARRYG